MLALEDHIETTPGPPTMEQAIDDWASVLTQADRIEEAVRHHAPGAFSARDITKAVEYSRDRHAELLAWLDREEGAKASLDPEDDALLLRAWQLRVGPLRFRGKRQLTYRHIAIDEVQDFSPIEVRVLLDVLDRRKSITLAGDTQQHVMANAGFTSWADFFRWLGVGGTSVETLKVAYRSSEPIVVFANALLGPLREDDSPPMTVRSGPDVEVFPFTDHGAVVAFLADTLKSLATEEPFASVAIVTPNPGVSRLYFDGLKRSEVPRLRLVTDDEFAFSPGVEIVEVQSVKGLEFDYVIVVEASANYYPDVPRARRNLHVAATRAIHQLWVTSVGALSPIVRDALGQQAANIAE
jgi:DNA helicase-2/ATP-dependent DNA helicase PcrA